MKPARAAPPPRPGSAGHIAEQLPRRRRRLGLALVALGALALGLQGVSEWLLPYNLASLDTARRLTGLPLLSAQQLVWAWALPCLALLAAMAQPRQPPLLLPPLAGLALGTVHAAAGGGAASLALLLLVGVASLGWQAGRQGGLSLLLATALGIVVWEWLVSDFPSLWAVVPVLVLVFVWIDLMHLRVNDRRLFGALAERDTLIQSLDQRTAELTALQGARTQLLASISHDLRQPLQAVRLYAEALQAADASSTPRDTRTPADPDATSTLARRSELLRQQMRAADDATAMLDQFSEFSAIEQGALQSRPELVELRDLLEAVAASLQAAHTPAQLRLSVHGRRQWAYTDRTQLARVVQNLAGNAVRYSLGAHPGRPARVVLALRPHTRGGDAGLAIDVVDNGRGIPADKLEAVFEPYVQLAEGAAAGGAPAGASRGGRGLGLAIVRGLAAQLGLHIAPVRSRVGHGTRFRVWLPAALRRDLPAPTAATPAAAADPARLDGWLLALLDDEVAPRTALRAALEGAGATIVDAGALDQLKLQLDEEPRFPDALVVDHDLGAGKPDGVAAVLELRAEWELMVPAVVVTGRVAAQSSIALPKRCSLLGKPVALATLVATLQRLRPVPGAATGVDIPVDVGGA